MSPSAEPLRAPFVAEATERSFFARDALEVAPQLLNWLIVSGDLVARIVEVEAYRGSADPASHAFSGETARNTTMFGPPGHLYVYFTYGMHFCANVVCGQVGEASAVLLRAAVPLAGLEVMRSRRARAADRLLCAGPARLCQAFAVDRELDGTDLLQQHGRVTLVRDGMAPPLQPVVGRRVGLSARVGEAADWPWRFGVEGNANLSKPF